MKLDAKHRLLARKDATLMFDQRVIEDKAATGYKSRDKLISMEIRDFLKLALPGHDRAKERGVKDLASKGQVFNTVAYLYYDWNPGNEDAKTTGHEGRHRARLLLGLGYTTMPVELRGPIRWSEQDDPDKFDYRPQWPLYLVSENGHEYIPFPVSREEVNQPYRP